MSATEMMIALILLRLILPFGSVLLIGEWLAGRERARFVRR